MYIGSTGSTGLHHLVYEVVDNSADEALAGYCNRIEVIIHADNSISVLDNGRGIPIDYHTEERNVCITTGADHFFMRAGNLTISTRYLAGYGVGVSCVNALSSWMKVEVYRDNMVYFMEFHRGIPLKR